MRHLDHVARDHANNLMSTSHDHTYCTHKLPIFLIILIDAMATLTKNEPNLFYTSHLSTIARKHNDQVLLVVLLVRIRLLLLLLLLGILTINVLLCLGTAILQPQPLLPLGEEILVLSGHTDQLGYPSLLVLL